MHCMMTATCEKKKKKVSAKQSSKHATQDWNAYSTYTIQILSFIIIVALKATCTCIEIQLLQLHDCNTASIKILTVSQFTHNE